MKKMINVNNIFYLIDQLIYFIYHSVYLHPGLLDSIANTANSADCPGVCVHALATLICDDVLEDVQCPTPSMRCCVNGPINGTEETSSSENDIEDVTSLSPVKEMTLSTTTTTTSTTTPQSTTVSVASTTTTTSSPPPPKSSLVIIFYLFICLSICILIKHILMLYLCVNN